jgi:hypothetical protein
MERDPESPVGIGTSRVERALGVTGDSMQQHAHACRGHGVGPAGKPDDAGGEALRMQWSGRAQSRGEGQGGEEALTD